MPYGSTTMSFALDALLTLVGFPVLFLYHVVGKFASPRFARRVSGALLSIAWAVATMGFGADALTAAAVIVAVCVAALAREGLRAYRSAA